MTRQGYSEYKESGSKWLGQIPSHWEIRTFQRCVYVAEGQVDPEEPEYADLILVAPNHIESGTGRLLFQETAREQGAESGKYLCEEGDVVYSKIRPSLRKVCISPSRCLCSADMYPLRGHSGINNHFLFWFMLSEAFSAIAVLESERVAMPKINRESLKAVKLLLPPIAEQGEIATFLDRETAKIDALIVEQERLIALLAEKRQAVISHAVTKGLDQTAEMKDSGVDWVGKMPAHWSLRTIQRCVFVAEGQVDPEDPAYSGMILLAPNHVESGTGRILSLETALEQGAESGKYLCAGGDVIYSKIRPALRKACLAPEDCLCSADMYPLRGHSGLVNHFLFWFILSEQFSMLAVLESDRVAMPKINRESLKAVHLLLPPEDEQLAISSFLDRETTKIDTLVIEANRAISLLHERRTALISAAVTGKIDVREHSTVPV